jgi:hypothetical protein
VQSVQDYENRLAEKNNQRPDPEEQVLIFWHRSYMDS